MQTITIDILNSKAIRLLEDLELLELIKFRRELSSKMQKKEYWFKKYKGAMSKQPINEIEEQLKQLRSE